VSPSGFAVVELIGSNQGAAARNVLHDQMWLAGDVLAQALCVEARPEMPRAVKPTTISIRLPLKNGSD
jgi:hypothetical protein